MTAGFVVTSAAAENDIEDIALYISADSTSSAERFGVEFRDALERIRAFPGLGRSIPGKPHLHSMRVSARFWRYLIIYRLENSGVVILRVLHGAMDLRASVANL
ncbi:MAG: type II toxin-antitoxin system RelE/ParE family toxin [Rhizomicrobium sp.]